MTVITFPQPFERAAEPKGAELDELAQDAYVFGFPLLMMDMAREAMQPSEGGRRVSPRPVLHIPRSASPTASELLEAPPYTLFACAWLDLCREPLIVSVPDAAGRYYSAYVLDAWSDVCAAFGARTNAGRARNYALVGPFWSGRLPEGVVRVQAPTPLVRLNLCIRAGDDEADAQDARVLRDKVRLSILSRWGESIETPAAEIEDETARERVSDKVIGLPAAEYYRRLCSLMVDNPPRAEDADFMMKLELLGIERKRTFDFRSLPWRVKAALGASVEGARKHLLERTGRLAPLRLVNGWRIARNTCGFGSDYDRRAHLALKGLRARDMADRILAIARTDNFGDRLHGDRCYEIAFAPGDPPPAKAFWTLSVRTPDAHGALHSAIDSSRLAHQKPRGATIRIQRSMPEGSAAWLSAPADQFSLALDLHWPDDEALEGRWRPPVVRRLV